MHIYQVYPKYWWENNVEDLELIMSIYNFLEYSSNYSDTTRSLLFHSKDEATNFNNDIADTTDFKTLKYKTKIMEETQAKKVNRILKGTTIAVPLKYLINFWRQLEMLFINCKVEFKT